MICAVPLPTVMAPFAPHNDVKPVMRRVHATCEDRDCRWMHWSPLNSNGKATRQAAHRHTQETGHNVYIHVSACHLLSRPPKGRVGQFLPAPWKRG